jgi:tetratricopeptide (TPR) repeat protein
MRTLPWIAAMSLFCVVAGDAAAEHDIQTLGGMCSRPDKDAAASKCSERFTGRGQLYLAKHDYDQAIGYFGKALWFNPDNADAARAFWQA